MSNILITAIKQEVYIPSQKSTLVCSVMASVRQYMKTDLVVSWHQPV